MDTTALNERIGAAAGGSGDRRIVVGLDGSPGARDALVWALAAAARSGSDLEVVAAFPVDFYWTDPYLLDTRRIDTIRSDTEARARAFVAEALSDPEVAALPLASAVPIEFVVVAGAPADYLVQRSDGAELLVVGSRGRGGVRSTLLGSVALHCSTHARCPVVVVHPSLRPASARVVVGIDDSAVSRAALVRAVEEAARLGCEVEAVVAYQALDYWSDMYAVMAPPLGEAHEQARRRAEGIVAEVLGDAAEAGVRVVADRGPAGDVLARQAEGAVLLVVGSRSRSRLEGMLLGSVALHCVVHAHCPVMVVHPEPAVRAAAGAAEAGVTGG